MKRTVESDERPDQGAVLMLVLAMMTIITLFLLLSLSVVLNNMTPARKDQDSKAAFMAAEAGLEEYMSRLIADSSYGEKWSSTNPDPSNPAFSTGQQIQGTGTEGASYTYQVLWGPANGSTSITLKVTGTSSPGLDRPAVSRSLTATLRPRSFLDYVYLTDFEVVDPDLTGASASCSTYYYTGRSGAAGCDNIQWVATDVVNGPLHSNDALQINGPVQFLNEKVESSWPAIKDLNPATQKTWWGTKAAPLTPNAPRYADTIELPAGAAELYTFTTPGRDGTSRGEGCYYRGGTRITFTGTSMKVLSPQTTASTLTFPDSQSRDQYDANCLDLDQDTRYEQTITEIPPVIYVDDFAGTCTAGKSSPTTSYSTSSGRSGVGYPVSGEKYVSGTATDSHTGSGTAITSNYDCHRGTAYVQGTVNGKVTLGANQDIVVTGDLIRASGDTGKDVIGLISTGYVWIYHPLNSSNGNLYSTPPVDTLEVAILAASHSFAVQNWGSGNPLGTLTVNGAIAQRFRGAVGTGTGTTISTGYQKDYHYDERFGYLQPPHFLLPLASPWYVESVSDK